MKVNNRVTVGIVTQPSYHAGGYSTKGTSYVPAGYVKWLEMAGARAVVVPWDATKMELNYILEHTNGILLPGGPQPDNNKPARYFRRVKWLYDQVIKINQGKRHFPLLGICQGFEQIVLSATNFGPELKVNYFKGTDNVLMPLDFTQHAAGSKMLNSSGMPALDKKVKDILSDKTHPVTPNFHSNGVLYDTFMNTNALGGVFNVLSTNLATNHADESKKFVSVVEGKNIPVYGLQWHTSLQVFEYNNTALSCLTHTKESILAMQYLANFFIDELRKDHASFNEKDLMEITFSNLPVTYAELIKGGPIFENAYFFGPPVLHVK